MKMEAQFDEVIKAAWYAIAADQVDSPERQALAREAASFVATVYGKFAVDQDGTVSYTLPETFPANKVREIFGNYFHCILTNSI
jgi:hypothetical protein